ncbi:hypothetical protein GOBAR_DD21050 [Gossypium barbadense]|nr:hypothetical protein GOBAR_DD21050 [Gossypium barbadense]
MAKNLMHALQYNNYGRGAAVLKHVEVPIPTPNKGEILLKLEAISLNPADWKIQKGMLRPFLPRKFPFIPASDVAGEVVVTNYKVGDKVVSLLDHLGLTKLLADNAPKAMKEQKLESYFGRKIVIDASMSIYQFLIVVGRMGTEMLTNETGEVTSYVFDGQPPDLKKQELGKRYSKRADATEDLQKAMETVEWYHRDRVMRQFRCIQYISALSGELGKIHGINKRGNKD